MRAEKKESVERIPTSPLELIPSSCRRSRRDSARQHKAKWMLAERLGGFCPLVRRAVLERAGPTAG
jgi:hypothetical protein